MFLTVFPLFMPKRESLPSIFTKELPWAIRSGPSWQKTKEWRERFALFQEWLLFCSFAHKKRVNRSKNWWATVIPKSQPWLYCTYLNPILHYYFRHCVRRQDRSHFVSPLFLTLMLVDIFRTTIKGRQIFFKPITVWRISSEYKMCCKILKCAVQS